eukprot:CAMPEP_0195523900 /NCGR_PEP_ID=MMETSP0794_2-20130614/23395_1 /TAXON_ID=515487 /ORGANISM="Stephanopyxis turris, Strain CCMP 815" /LENGTH=779 /DNA_ID=CAMNT_0040653999 /DNA_START=323 /DNA_END=2659 /DNA_ORIENTATION=+
MDELQDAIEDAQYVNAIATVDEGPRPMLAWEFPTDEQLEEWKRLKIAELTPYIKSKSLDGNKEAAPSLVVSAVTTKTEASKVSSKEVPEDASDKKHSDITAAAANPPDQSEDKEIASVIPESISPETTISVTPTPVEQRLDDIKEETILESIYYVCSNALGFFLFAQFLKEDCKDYLRINFIEDVILFRRVRGSKFREDKARNIATTYLTIPLAEVLPKPETGNAETVINTETAQSTDPVAEKEGHRNVGDNRSKKKPSRKSLNSKKSLNISTHSDDIISDTELVIEDPPKNETKLPACKEICELDLCRPSSRIPLSRFQNIVQDNLDLNYSHNFVGIKGRALKMTLERALGGIPHHLRLDEERSSITVHPEGDKKNIEELTEDNEETELDSYYTKKSESNRDIFDLVELIVLEGLKREYWKKFLQSKLYRKWLNFMWFQDRKVVEEDFFLMRVLGRGGFGLVHGCKKGTSGKLFAMKVMNKKRIKIKKSEQLTLNERSALASVDSPFVVKLSYSFQSKDNIFLILDLMTGGDLGFHLVQKGRFTRKESLYFSARIMLGLQALHDRQYVYRDLKPENCLMGDDGRVKLSDLGLATKIHPTLHGAAGTRGYWAPEMLRRNANGKRLCYGHTVDWFSFGCVVAEFISGINPFRSEAALNFGLKQGKTSKEKAIDCATMEMTPVFDPAKFDHDSADLCLRLLDKDETKRLGRNGCEEIMSHRWFRDLNWEAILCDRMKPPFVPAKDVNAASQSEIGTFAEDKVFHETVVDEKDRKIYENWDW